MAKSNHSQRRQGEIIKENTMLKRRVARLEANLFHWKTKWAPIHKAVVEGDNLRAIALMQGWKGGRNGKT